MEQKLISPEESLPNEGEIVYLILYEGKDKVRDDFFVSVFYAGNFLTGRRNSIPFEKVYKWSPTGKYYSPFKEAKSLIQQVIDQDNEDDGNEEEL